MAIILTGSTGVATPAVTDASGGNTATINSMTPTADSLQGFRNRIINGDMRIDQRNAGASATFANTGAYSIDRWRISNAVSTVTAQQSTTAPTGFNNSLLITVTSADSNPPSSGTSHALQYYIEGTNVADLGFGSASAKTVTLSFWVRSSLTGTYGIQIGNNAPATRAYVAQYTINSANTFEYKTITISGDTTGTWATNTGIGIAVIFDLGSGSSYQAASANTWTTSDNRRISGNALFASTASATFYITGVQLEVGSVATPFERRPYGTELALCQRYYYRLGPSITNSMFGVGWNISTTQAASLITFPVTMRTSPSALEQSGTAGDYAVFHGAGSGTACSSVPTFGVANTQNCRILLTVASGLTANGGSMTRAETTNGYLGFSAEL